MEESCEPNSNASRSNAAAIQWHAFALRAFWLSSLSYGVCALPAFLVTFLQIDVDSAASCHATYASCYRRRRQQIMLKQPIDGIYNLLGSVALHKLFRRRWLTLQLAGFNQQWLLMCIGKLMHCNGIFELLPLAASRGCRAYTQGQPLHRLLPWGDTSVNSFSDTLQSDAFHVT